MKRSAAAKVAPTGTRRGWVARGLVLGLVAWTAFACAVELYRTRWAAYHDPWPETAPDRWRITSEPVARMQGFADRVAPYLPPGSRVWVYNEPGPASARLFRFLWLTYLLPEVDTHRLERLATDAQPGWLITYGGHVAAPWLETVVEAPEGGLYRLRLGGLRLGGLRLGGDGLPTAEVPWIPLPGSGS